MKCGKKIWSTFVDYFLIIGAIVGVGFASGKDLYVFFYQFGGNSLFGLAGFVLIYIYLFLIVQYVGEKLKLNKYDKFNAQIFGKFSKITNVVLLINFTITSAGMLAGANYLFSTFLGVKHCIPSFILSLLLLFLLFGGENKIKAMANVVVPIIIAIIVINGFNKITPQNVSLPINKSSSMLAIFYGILFAVNNFVPALPVLVETKIKTKGKILSILTIAFIMLVAILTLSSNNFLTGMPLLEIASSISTGFYYVYLIAIIFALFCTLMICSMNSFKILSKGKKSIFISLFVVILNIIISFLGYDFIVNYLYVVSGLISALYVLFMIVFIIINLSKMQVKNRNKIKQNISKNLDQILKN